MKKLFPLLLCFALMVTACENKENDTTQSGGQSTTTEQIAYGTAGKMIIEMKDGPFESQDTITVALDTESQTISLTMMGVRFAEQMPITLTISADSVPYVQQEHTYAFEQDTVVLNMLIRQAKIPYPDCPLLKLKGMFDTESGELKLSGTFDHKIYGKMPMTYEGSAYE